MTNPVDQDSKAVEAERRRIVKGRNIAVALLLLGMVLLFYFITISRLSH
jgi:hypothetical protein